MRVQSCGFILILVASFAICAARSALEQRREGKKNNRKKKQEKGWPDVASRVFPWYEFHLILTTSKTQFCITLEPSLPVETCTYPAMKFGFSGTFGGPSICRSLQYEGVVRRLGCSGPHENTCEPRFLLKRFASGSSSSSYEFNPCKKIPLLFSLPTPLRWRGQRWKTGRTPWRASPFPLRLLTWCTFHCLPACSLRARCTSDPALPKRNHCDHFLWEGKKKKSGLAAFSEEVSKKCLSLN